MKCIFFYVLLFFFTFLPTYAFTCQVTDDLKQNIHLNQPAKRIITLAPDLTEILFAISVGQNIIATVDSSDYPSAALHIPRIGSYTGIDLERIVSLHPDLIVTWGHNFSRELRVLKKMGIPVYTTVSRYLQDVPRTMQNLGCLTAHEQDAQKQVTIFTDALQKLQKQYHHQKIQRVFYQIGGAALFTINQENWINQVITLCGGQNIFASLKTPSPEVSWEAVIAANPQVIISDATGVAWKKHWARWQQVAAVRDHRLFTIDPNLIDRAGPRLVEGAKRICVILSEAKDH